MQQQTEAFFKGKVMTLDELSNILADMYRNSEHREAKLSIHLFGIKYGNEIEKGRQTKEFSIKEIVEKADLPESYQTEVSVGVNLSRYVRLK